MYHNFTFVDANTSETTFFAVNPTRIEEEGSFRQLWHSLDGPPKIIYADTTQKLLTLIWENIPARRTSWIQNITSLADKTGTLYFNRMEQMFGMQNMMAYSSCSPWNGSIGTYFHSATPGCTAVGTAYFDQTVYSLSPDGQEKVHPVVVEQDSFSTGCIATQDYMYFKEKTVLSVYVKQLDWTIVGINTRKATNGYLSIVSSFEFDPSDPENLLIVSTSAYADHADFSYVGNGWFRIWHVIDWSEYYGEQFAIYLYPHYYGDSADFTNQSGNYMWGFQVEYGVDTPRPLLKTEGQAVNFVYNCWFGKPKIDVNPKPGELTYTIKLPMVVADWWV